jgi:hypothetical protein
VPLADLFAELFPHVRVDLCAGLNLVSHGTPPNLNLRLVLFFALLLLLTNFNM